MRWLWGTAVPLIPDIVLPLIGAALVLRHPNARRHQPWLLLGAILLAVEVLGTTVRVPVQDLLWQRLPPSDPGAGVSIPAWTYRVAFPWSAASAFCSWLEGCSARAVRRAAGPDTR